MTEPAGPPVGWINLTLQGSPLSSGWLTPKVRLNGYDVATQYGLNVLPVPPGPWHVDVRCQWITEYGRASLDVEVLQGQSVPLFYAAPLHQFSGGSLGPEKQTRNGKLGFAVLMLLIIAVVALVSVVPALTG